MRQNAPLIPSFQADFFTLCHDSIEDFSIYNRIDKGSTDVLRCLGVIGKERILFYLSSSL